MGITVFDLYLLDKWFDEATESYQHLTSESGRNKRKMS